MVNVWKIGAWPGFPGEDYSSKNKRIFINEYALPKNYVAIGWEDCTVKKCENKSRKYCKTCKQQKEFLNFNKYIREKDIILLYNHFKAYVGKVENPHYLVNDKPRHRIDVKWLFHKKPKKVDFHLWQDTVHQVLEKDIPKIKDNELKEFIIKKGIGSEVIPIDKTKENSLTEDTVRRKYGSGGEGKKHKELKEYIYSNPECISLRNVIDRKLEYKFRSGDRVDILFRHPEGRFTVVEVETYNPRPGAYQALKYKVLKCAELEIPIQSSKVEAVLVAWEIPIKLESFCNKYKIKYVEIEL